MSPARRPRPGLELAGHRLIEPLPHEPGELEAPLWIAEEAGTRDRVLIALLGSPWPGSARLAEDSRRSMYDRCLRLAQTEHPVLPDLVESASPEQGECFVAWAMPPAVPLRTRLAYAPGELGFALRLLGSAARGVAALHAAGEVHGALCPALLAVGDRELAHLLAAGCGSLRLEDPTLAVAARYRAPEQLAPPGHGSSFDPALPDVGPSADVWALGVLLYELLEGVPPHSGATVEEVRRSALALTAPALGVRPGPDRARLDELISRSIDPDPGRRFADAGDMADAIDSLRQRVDPRTVARGSQRPRDGAAAARPLIVTSPLEPAVAPWRRADGRERDEGQTETLPLALWLVPAALLLGLAALLLWWIGVV